MSTLGTLAILGTSFIGQSKRQLGNGSLAVLPDCVIEEVHTDKLTTTDHPVEYGFNITDHAYAMPAELVLTYGFTNAKTIVGPSPLIGLAAAASVLLGADPVNSTYAELVAFQQQRQLFAVYTKRRKYSNMLITSLTLTTDKDTENAAFIKIGMKQVRIATTQIVSKVPPETQANPTTASPMSLGAQALKSATGFATGAVNAVKDAANAAASAVGSISGVLG